MNIIYDSGGSIDLTPGFIAEHGVTWQTLLDGCIEDMMVVRTSRNAPMQEISPSPQKNQFLRSKL